MASKEPTKKNYYRKNCWRGGYVAKNKSFRGKGSKNFARNVRIHQPCHSKPSVLNETSLLSIETKGIDLLIIDNLKNIENSPYYGWKLYFPDDDFKTSAIIIRKVKAVEDFILRHKELFNEEEIDERRSCIFDLKICLSDDEFIRDWATFTDDFFNIPFNSLNCLGLAVHQFVWKSLIEQSRLVNNDDDDHIIEVPMIKARIINYNKSVQFKSLKTNYYGKLVSVTGTAIRVSNVKLHCLWLAFQCVGCNTIQCVKQIDNGFVQPKTCLNKECSYRTFKSLYSSPYTQTYDWQTVRLQEQAPDDQRESGRVPRTIECELTDDLVNCCSPGDVLTITGIVKVHSVHRFKKNRGPNVFTLYLQAVSIMNNKRMNCSNNSNKDSNEIIHFTQKDYNDIQKIHSEPNLFKLLVHSLCPTIYGHEIVKAGLLLALFGGSTGDLIDTRGQAHVLVVGDPGLGKSQMLQACSFIAPRGVFVCGNMSTSSGLTVTLTRGGSGDYSLEAGALVLADQGCCCIDEFDKMSTQHQALLEVMEQQTVSIAKAGVICMLPARTTVIAAANPAGGHYNKSKTVSENLRMGQALLSRFDLVFILLDKPDERLDCLLSEHVMKMHSNFTTQLNKSFEQEQCSTVSLNTENILLSEKLKLRHCENVDLIPSQLLRKYIAYARKYVSKVSLDEGSRKALQEFYLQLRKNHHTLDSTPITTRQLLSLIRLTQARAKLELREKANVADALEVIDIVRWSLIDTYSDEFGVLYFDRSQYGSGISTKNQAKRFLTALHRKSEILSRSVFTIAEMKEIAKTTKIDVRNFSSFISTLNIQGFLLKKGRETYQVLSAD